MTEEEKEKFPLIDPSKFNVTESGQVVKEPVCKEQEKMTDEEKVRKYNPYGQYEILRARIADLEKENAELQAQIEKMTCENKYVVSDDASEAVPCYTVYDCEHCSKRS